MSAVQVAVRSRAASPGAASAVPLRGPKLDGRAPQRNPGNPHAMAPAVGESRGRMQPYGRDAAIVSLAGDADPDGPRSAGSSRRLRRSRPRLPYGAHRVEIDEWISRNEESPPSMGSPACRRRHIVGATWRALGLDPAGTGLYVR
jgi:hypothetical protein